MKTNEMRILLTGAAGGIGVALAAELLRGGARVLLTGRDEKPLLHVVARIGVPRERVQVVAADLANRADRERLSEIAQTWAGGINVLINNAGVSRLELFDDTTCEDIDRSFAINAIAPIDLCRLLMPHLRRQPHAQILNIGSVFGTIGYPGYSVYSATKFALRGFTESLRRELAGSGVRAHYLAPRSTKTQINSDAVARMNAELGTAMDEPQRVARTALRMLAAGNAEQVIGWPEKLFARINAILPRLVDRALSKQLPVIRAYASRALPEPSAAAPIAQASAKLRRLS